MALPTPGAGVRYPSPQRDTAPRESCRRRPRKTAPTGPQGRPSKLTQHTPYTTRTSPLPAGPSGSRPTHPIHPCHPSPTTGTPNRSRTPELRSNQCLIFNPQCAEWPMPSCTEEWSVYSNHTRLPWRRQVTEKQDRPQDRPLADPRQDRDWIRDRTTKHPPPPRAPRKPQADPTGADPPIPQYFSLHNSPLCGTL